MNFLLSFNLKPNTKRKSSQERNIKASVVDRAETVRCKHGHPCAKRHQLATIKKTSETHAKSHEPNTRLTGNKTAQRIVRQDAIFSYDQNQNPH